MPVIVGPGSEWFWAMAQFVVVAVTGFAIFNQLRAQRSTAVYEQMSSWSHEFDAPLMTRHKLALMLAIQKRDVSRGLPRANDEVPDFFDRVGYLVSRGHVRLEDFWSDSRPVVAFYWGVMAPYIHSERERIGDPTVYRWFEWLEREMQKLDMRRLGRSRSFDPQTRQAAVADRIEIFRARLDRSGDTWRGADANMDAVEVDEAPSTDDQTLASVADVDSNH